MDIHSTLNLISICTGGGGLDLGIKLAMPSSRVVCMVEREAYACGRLVEAMEEGRLAEAPIWIDARTFNGRGWRGLVDGLIGGIPCQPHSLAGQRGGSDDERDLWTDTRRIIVQAMPREPGRTFVVLIENVPGMLTAKPGQVPGAERVWRDLQRMGFQVEGGLFSAEEVGFSHERERIFILGVCGVGLADAADERPQGSQPGRNHRLGERPASQRGGGPSGTKWRPSQCARITDDDGNQFRWREAPGGSELCRQGVRQSLGVGLVDPKGFGRGEGRPEPELRRRGRPASGPSGEVGDPNGSDLGGRPIQPQRGPEGRTAPDRARSFPAFAPGPDDYGAWTSVLAERPDFAPALPQSALRRMADGVDRPRIDELRLAGNGVVPLCAAYAFRTLVHRLAQRDAPGARKLWSLCQ